MFGKVKRWLGIEGVKITLVLPEEIIGETRVVRGEIKLESMHAQTVTRIRLTLTEKYTRGRSSHKLTDLYKLGEIELHEPIDVPAGEPVIIDFELPFILAKSEMDELAESNFVLRKIVGAAKRIKNVKSEFFLEAEAQVRGTALSPFDRQAVTMI